MVCQTLKLSKLESAHSRDVPQAEMTEVALLVGLPTEKIFSNFVVNFTLNCVSPPAMHLRTRQNDTAASEQVT